MPKPEIISVEPLCEGKFIALNLLEYVDARGVSRKWESADRRDGSARSGTPSAVFIVAKIVPDDELLLVRQFRPPAGRLMVEFPAGLVDPGESVETTAARELYEETGYEGKLIYTNVGSYSSPGMTGEALALALMVIDGEKYRDALPQPHPEECENIEVLRVKMSELENFVQTEQAKGNGIDSKIVTYLAMQKF